MPSKRDTIPDVSLRRGSTPPKSVISTQHRPTYQPPTPTPKALQRYSVTARFSPSPLPCQAIFSSRYTVTPLHCNACTSISGAKKRVSFQQLCYIAISLSEVVVYSIAVIVDTLVRITDWKPFPQFFADSVFQRSLGFIFVEGVVHLGQ